MRAATKAAADARSKVIDLRPAACSECIHVALVRAGLHCQLFNEPLWDEREAQSCLGFER